MSRKQPKQGSRIAASGIRNQVETPYVFTPIGGRDNGNHEYWGWGSDNLFPYALAMMSRCSVPHRRIINDKADYISGKGVSVDENQTGLSAFVNHVNGDGETLRQVLNKLAFDKSLFGNAFLEVVSDQRFSFLSLFHQDASRCRVAYDSEHVMLHHNWCAYNKTSAKKLPLWPRMEIQEDGTLRSMIHYKDYEPMFEHYGVPPYIAGMNVSAIAYKTDKWNISRLDNSFQLSGVMMLDSSVDSDEEAQRIVQLTEKKFAGKPGQVMFVIRDGSENDNSRFIPIASQNEGDWKSLHEQATSDIVIAHSWFRALSGLDYASGFSTERIINEYQIALNTVILPEQMELLEPIRDVVSRVLKFDCASLHIINRPPVSEKQGYMYIWEARKMDGLDYDPKDVNQQGYIAQIKSV